MFIIISKLVLRLYIFAVNMKFKTQTRKRFIRRSAVYQIIMCFNRLIFQVTFYLPVERMEPEFCIFLTVKCVFNFI